ncbi:MAG: GNAT family N-acetyltransferase [Muribaculaceae bacterium]|nr:GNAT family N-acetyltransferase [Muribaculaceae bacterium]
MIQIKQITDINSLMKWRREVIENVFEQVPSEELLEQNKSFYHRHLNDNSHLAYVAFVDEKEAGCGSICLTEELPSPDNTSGRCAYLMNIYVRERFREKGVGHEIVKRLINEAKLRDCKKIYLETTAEGRPVYESLGFHDLPDIMKLK